MLRKNVIKSALKAGEEVFGLVNSVPLPTLIEMIAYADYDFVILDLEHLLRDPSELEHAIRAAECSGITPLVRVPIDSPHLIKHALDSGAQGIVVPQVSSKAQIELAANACYYPPQGTRGITGGKNTGFGRLSITDYVKQANEEVMLVVMIETKEGLANLDEILNVPGIDMVLEGALDLSVSLGHGHNTQHADVQNAIDEIALRCSKFNLPFCAIPRVDGQIEKWRAKGITAFVAGQDRGILFRALQKNLAQFKPPSKPTMPF
ncbi:HpcH/HpaI aldolase family protein [Thalassotalea ganghwensis]